MIGKQNRYVELIQTDFTYRMQREDGSFVKAYVELINLNRKSC
jgi:hypothetical protein